MLIGKNSLKGKLDKVQIVCRNTCLFQGAHLMQLCCPHPTLGCLIGPCKPYQRTEFQAPLAWSISAYCGQLGSKPISGSYSFVFHSGYLPFKEIKLTLNHIFKKNLPLISSSSVQYDPRASARTFNSHPAAVHLPHIDVCYTPPRTDHISGGCWESADQATEDVSQQTGVLKKRVFGSDLGSFLRGT